MALDLSDPEKIKGIFNGLDAVIHLAANPSPAAPWESVERNNIKATYNVFKECVRSGVRRLVFASTNHVQHGNTMLTTPETLDPNRVVQMKLTDQPNPDSLYAVSKLFGEGLGKLYSEQYDLEFVGLRIGSTIPEDDPTVKTGTSAEDYIRAMFLSQRDCVQAFIRALEVDTRFMLAYAISRNDRRVFDLKKTERILGFHPVDNAEDYFRGIKYVPISCKPHFDSAQCQKSFSQPNQLGNLIWAEELAPSTDFSFSSGITTTVSPALANPSLFLIFSSINSGD